MSDMPRGIEVLLKKAHVDPAFRVLLLAERDAAAAEIGLELDATEVSMLRAIPAAQLEGIIDGTKVEPASRRAFLGKAAAAMLAALGAAQAGCSEDDPSPAPKGIRPDNPGEPGEGPKKNEDPKPPPPPEPTGIRPDRPPAPKGIRPDRPPSTKGIRPGPPKPPPPPPDPVPPPTRGIQPDQP